MDILQIITTIMANIAIIIATIIGIIQLRDLTKNTKADFERRKKQSTIEIIFDLDKVQNELETMLKNSDIEWPIPIEILNDNKKIKTCVMSYLNTIENIAVGTNIGIFDITVIARLNGNNLINRYNDLRKYIDHERESYPGFYVDFERLVTRLLKYRTISNPTDYYSDDDATLKNDPLKKA